MFSQLFAVAALAVSARSVFAVQCTRSYTVKEGDICDTISQAHNVSTWQLATVNTGSINGDCTDLVPGHTICLGVKPEEDCTTTYTVAVGDTCESISSNNAVNTTILYLNNPQIDDGCSNIYVGEVLCTAKTVQVPPTPANGVTLLPPGTTTTVLPSKTPVPAPVANVAPVKNSPAPAAQPTHDDHVNDDDLPFCDEI